jgi:chaperonin GroES
VDSFPKELIVVGDRVLIASEEGEEQRTHVGLYLPATAIDSIAVQTGMIVATGPGDPLPDPTAFETEPWKVETRAPRTRPMQARVGDTAIYFRKAAIEVTFQERRYLVVPLAAILILVRDKIPLP